MGGGHAARPALSDWDCAEKGVTSPEPGHRLPVFRVQSKGMRSVQFGGAEFCMYHFARLLSVSLNRVCCY